MHEKRQKGLCFRCDEKWHIKHQCKRCELSILLAPKNEEGKESKVNFDYYTLKDIDITTFNVSLNSMVGLDNLKTMKAWGSIVGQWVVVMINLGAT